MCKSGWNETSGLGVREQGLICPIKAKKKKDRSGIGNNSHIDSKNNIKNESKSPNFKQKLKNKNFEKEFRSQFK
jgi:hypothetical protein